MNKTAIKNFAVWARRKLIGEITDKARLLGVTETGVAEPLVQSTKDLQFFDIGTKNYAEVQGVEISQRNALVSAIKGKAKELSYQDAFQNVVEEIAYTWFNRMIAIRFMEVNDYLPSRVRVLSSENPGKLEPDFVTTPFDTDLEFTSYEQDRVMQLKDENKLDELFRMLFIKQCNKLHEILPELFEATSDYTELLLTISFTDKDGVVYHLTHDIPESDFDIEHIDEDGKISGQVEIIGWMYQYYNTELFNSIFDGDKSRKSIESEDIPAATQLFTPDWSVRYMVENSLGRLWLEGHPDKVLQNSWKYYLEEAVQEPDVQIQLAEIRDDYVKLTPEDIKIIDPCMGSGHILVYAFDVLMQIYEAQGYTQRDATRLIVEKNIYGLDIDKRAYQLAYFAVMMKARQYNRRILNGEAKPNLYAIDDSSVMTCDVMDYIANGDKKMRAALQSIANDLTNAKEYGSIINVAPVDFDAIYNRIEEINNSFASDLFAATNQKIAVENVLPLIKQAQVMAKKYQVVCTNPPYLNSARMNNSLLTYIKQHYEEAKADFSSVMYLAAQRNFSIKNGFISFITTNSWMYLKSFVKLRELSLNNLSFSTIVDYGTELFEGKIGHLPIIAWVSRNAKVNQHLTAVRLVDFRYGKRNEKYAAFFNLKNHYYPVQSDFFEIDGAPIVYWFSSKVLKSFELKGIGDFAEIVSGMTTGDNEKYLRFWHELSTSRIAFNRTDLKEIDIPSTPWIPYHKGGEQRKWFGNNEYVVNWGQSKNFNRAKTTMTHVYLKPCITWSDISGNSFAGRYCKGGFMFDVKGSCAFATVEKLYLLIGLFNSKITPIYVEALNPTSTTQVGDLKRIPFAEPTANQAMSIKDITGECISISKEDWDMDETSWDFRRHPMLSMGKLADAYTAWKADCESRFLHLKANEEELNRIFIDIYGLQDELTPDVVDKDVTVHCVFDTKDDVMESMKGSNYVRTMHDEIVSLISYAVGCMFGRYSLDVDGLAYAGGEWDNSKYQTFRPDQDNCIPVTDEEYLQDDIVGRFVEFVRTVYGSDTLEENLDFIAKALGNKGNTSREIIRNYFLNDFIKDHIKTYQKRPIYWMFDSGKQNGFKALVYMHRWNADTTGNVRVEYLHRIQRVYESEINRMQDTIDNSSVTREISAAQKRKDKLSKQLKESKDYDAKIAHLALSRINIDLDDGVKVNYEKVQTGQDGKKIAILTAIK